MPRKTWTLTQLAPLPWDDVFVEELDVVQDQVGDGRPFRVRKRTLRGGLRDGCQVVEIDNGRIRFVVLPDRGMGLWRVWHGDLTLGWPSPVRGPVNPRFVPVAEASGIGWLNGFDELLCRCGLEFNGAPEWGTDGKLLHSLHGRIANLPAHELELGIDSSLGEISLTGVVDEARLFGNNLRLTSTVNTRLGEPRLWITDEVSNLSTQAAEFELLYHINFGPPLAAPGSRFYAPVDKLAPRDAFSAGGVARWQEYESEQSGAQEVVLYMDLATDEVGRTSVLLASPDGERGVQLHFNRQQLPLFALWKNRQPAQDGYCTGLEPCVNFPNVKSFEKAQGRVVALQPGESRVFQIGMEVCSGAAAVEQAIADISHLGRGVQPQIFDQPRREWSPG